MKFPPGFRYQPDFISVDEERKLLEAFKNLPLETWHYKGYESKKKMKGFDRKRGFPTFFLPIIKRIAAFAGILPSHLEHALVAEYSPGTGIGWHRDHHEPRYQKIIGISLGSPAVFRLRQLPQKFDAKSNKRKWNRFSITAEPRSIYIMSGESISRWQHSVAPVTNFRYSLTIRTLEK